MGRNVPHNPKPETAPEANKLKAKIENSATRRDRVTRRLLSKLIPINKSPEQFIVDACKFAGIKPPKPGDSLASYVYELQKQVCEFDEIDAANARDGMLGPHTFGELIKKIPQLEKGYSKQARSEAYTSDKRRNLVRSIPQLAELPRISNHQNALLVGDSLMKAPALGFYQGTDKYKKYHGVFFKRSRHVEKGKKILADEIDKYKKTPAYVVWLGTNDLGRSANAVFNDLKAIYKMILKKNPRARIVAITLLPRSPKYQRKVLEINRRIKKYAQNHSRNMSVIDMHDQVIAAQKAGHKVFYRDRIHIRPPISSALKRMLKDHLTQNKNGQLTDYL